MVDMVRKLAIDRLVGLKNYYTDQDIDGYIGFDEKDIEVIDFAISDMELVGELKEENELLREKIFKELHIDHEMIEAENKYFKDGIEKVKEEIKHTDFDMMDYYDHTETIREMVLNVINKYLGE